MLFKIVGKKLLVSARLSNTLAAQTLDVLSNQWIDLFDLLNNFTIVDYDREFVDVNNNVINLRKPALIGFEYYFNMAGAAGGDVALYKTDSNGAPNFLGQIFRIGVTEDIYSSLHLNNTNFIDKQAPIYLKPNEKLVLSQVETDAALLVDMNTNNNVIYGFNIWLF